MNRKLLERQLRVTKEIKHSIDKYMMRENQRVMHKPNQMLAELIFQRIEKHLAKPIYGGQVLLADYDEKEDGYKNPRIVNGLFNDAHEALFPLDPETDEPVEDGVADVAIFLPDIHCIKEL